MMRLILTTLLLMGASGCATWPEDHIENGKVSMDIASDNHSYIRSLKLHKDGKGYYLWGVVRPGRRSHVYRSYSGHIDITDQETKKLLLTIYLGQKTKRFIRRIDLNGKVNLLATYSKVVHSSHSEK